jgi:Fic family protein
MPYEPRFEYSAQVLRGLARVERARTIVDLLPLPLSVEKRMRKDARVRVAHNSTWIENRTLSLDQARKLIEEKAQQDPTRAASEAEAELRNYWEALEFIEIAANHPFSEDLVCQLHAVIYRGMKGPGRPPAVSNYRNHQVQVGKLEYLPPEAKDVLPLMAEFAEWVRQSEKNLPGPVLAAIVAYQFVTIHPFSDGNGRTCRALATLMLKRTGYGMKGMASMESFYAADLDRYYDSLQMGLHHNYYESNTAGSRSNPDLTPWIEFFLEVLGKAAEELQREVELEARVRHPTLGQNPLDPLPRPVRKVIGELANLTTEFPPAFVAELLGVSTKTAREWLAAWCDEGYFEPAKEGAARIRNYRVAIDLREAIETAGLE